uniref:Uncharacterized protein n=1 Tax=Oryza punctata TaxID=4537 RepID=A0A0E0L625_ORYPU
MRAAAIVGPRLVAIGNVRVRDAPAVLALLDKEVVRHAWEIEHRHRLARLARLDHELDIILDAIVPILIHAPFHIVTGRELLRYGWSVQHLAVSIFGPVHALHAAVGPVGRFLRRHARHQHQGTRGAAWLADNILEVRDRVSALKSLLVQFPEEDPAVVAAAAGGGDDDDGAEFAEDGVGSDVSGGGGELQRIVIHGLSDAVLSAAAIVGPRLVTIGNVCVRDAPAVLALLDKEVVRHAWEIEHRHRLARLARLNHELDIVLEAIVPTLNDMPLHLVAGRELLRFGWSLQHLAVSIFGPVHALHAAVGPVGRLLRRHARHQHHGTRDAAWLAGNILEVRDRASVLKSLMVEFPEEDPAVAAGDDDHDDGPEFAEDDVGFDGSDDEE